jgi:hypothetical protein
MTRNAIRQAAVPLLVLALMVLSAWVWFLHATCTGDGRESFTNKHEWSILQSLPARHTEPVPGIQFTQHEAYRIISLPSVSGERLWIMLNPQSPPYYKQMPHGDYELTADQLSQVVRSWQPISTVEQCLESHVRRDK